MDEIAKKGKRVEIKEGELFITTGAISIKGNEVTFYGDRIKLDGITEDFNLIDDIVGKLKDEMDKKKIKDLKDLWNNKMYR